MGVLCLVGGAAQSFAFSPTLGGVITNTYNATTDIPYLLSAVSYLAGVALAIMAILKLKDHVTNPNQTPLSDSVKRFLAGGALFALPIVTEALYNSLSGPLCYMTAGLLCGPHTTGFNESGTASGLGLDQIMIKTITDIWGPLQLAISGFCYLSGLILAIVGISRILKSSQEGPRGPTGFGTIMTFLVAGVLLSYDAILGAFGNSMFGTFFDQVQTYSTLSFNTSALDPQAINNVISAVLAFVMILGVISFIRGFFILRDFSEGNHQASLMAGLTHIFGGALAVNLGPVLNAVQATFGLTSYGITFS